MNSTLLRNVLLAATLMAAPSLSYAAIVYDNTTTSLGVFYSGQAPGNQFGDEITLSGTERTLSGFSILYNFNGAAGTATGVLRLYDTTGPLGAPGTLLYDGSSLPFNLQPGQRTQPVNFSAVTPPIILPGTLIWTIQFAGASAAQAGLLVYGPPGTGSSPGNDFWENSGGMWNRFVVSGAARSDFAAQVTAVPEPSALALGALALVAGAGFAGYRKLRQ